MIDENILGQNRKEVETCWAIGQSVDYGSHQFGSIVIIIIPFIY
jgi:hypothetical protein